MGFPWPSHGKPMGPGYSYRLPMGLSWDRGPPMGFSWGSHGLPTAFPWVFPLAFNKLAMGFPRASHGTEEFPWASQWKPVPIGIPWLPTSFPWDQGVRMGFPWETHGTPMGLPWDAHGN